MNKQFIYAALTSLTSLLIFYLNKESQAVWVLWAALPLMCIVIENTAWQRILSIGVIGFLAAVIVISFNLCHVALVNGLLLTLIIGATVYLGMAHTHRYLSYIYLGLTAIIASLSHLSFSQAIQSASYLLIGALLAGFYQLIFLIHEKQDRLNRFYNECLNELNYLQQTLFACLIDPDYPEKRYQSERQLHIQKYQFMRSITAYAELSKGHVAAQLIQIYSTLLECTLIRWRVSDFTLFSLCQTELSDISLALSQMLSSHFKQDLQRLNDCIDQFDDLYEHVLKVTAKEPLVVLLFIGSLRSLQNEIRIMREMVCAE